MVFKPGKRKRHFLFMADDDQVGFKQQPKPKALESNMLVY